MLNYFQIKIIWKHNVPRTKKTFWISNKIEWNQWAAWWANSNFVSFARLHRIQLNRYWYRLTIMLPKCKFQFQVINNKHELTWHSNGARRLEWMQPRILMDFSNQMETYGQWTRKRNNKIHWYLEWIITALKLLSSKMQPR